MLTYFENYPRKKTCAFNVARLLSTSVLIEKIKILVASWLVAKLPGGEMTSNPASHYYYVVTRACGRRSDWCGLYVLVAYMYLRPQFPLPPLPPFSASWKVANSHFNKWIPWLLYQFYQTGLNVDDDRDDSGMAELLFLWNQWWLWRGYRQATGM